MQHLIVQNQKFNAGVSLWANLMDSPLTVCVTKSSNTNITHSHFGILSICIVAQCLVYSIQMKYKIIKEPYPTSYKAKCDDTLGN